MCVNMMIHSRRIPQSLRVSSSVPEDFETKSVLPPPPPYPILFSCEEKLDVPLIYISHYCRIQYEIDNRMVDE
jgi:hypothetical protein